MTIYFVSSADGSDSDNGLTLDTAWATLKYAEESGGLSTDDVVMIRRTHSEIPTANIVPAYDGAISAPIVFTACPRAQHNISSSDWTNGSTTVTNDDADMTRKSHQARYIIGPDGNRYLITRVVSSSSIVIDREYAGSTVSNNATAYIEADPSIDAWDNYDDSSDTIKKTDWEADSDDCPTIDFNDAAYFMDVFGDHYHSYHNIEFKDSSAAYGIIRVRSVTYFEGCLFKQNASNDVCLSSAFYGLNLKRFTVEGSGSGSSQDGLLASYANLNIKDGAIYNCGDNGISTTQTFGKIDNVNIGVEQANGDDDISSTRGCDIKCKDLKLGGTNGLIDFNPSTTNDPYYFVEIENYGKVLGSHRSFYPGGYHERAAVSGETPNKKNSDYVIKIVPNVNGAQIIDLLTCKVFEFFIDGVTTGSQTLTLDIYNDMGATINDGDAKGDMFLELEYLAGYDDTSEYIYEKSYSSENTIADATDADDWDSLSVTFNPAATGRVYGTVYLRTYSAVGTLFIDPAWSIA